MPLAIELAASWVRLLSCAEIAGEIERGLAFLAVSLRNIPERHRLGITSLRPSLQAQRCNCWAAIRREPEPKSSYPT